MVRPLLAVAGIVASVLVTLGAQMPAPAPLTAADYVDIETAYGRSLHDVGGLRRWLTNLSIEPTRTGALAWAYVVEGRGLEFLSGALYHDQWVNTSDGWRMRRRAVYPGTAMPPREHYAPPSNLGERRFSARDYFEIKHVVWRYNLGYDNAAPYDGGVLSSLLFTHDALFERLGLGDSKGRAELVAYAKERQKTGSTHHWDAKMVFDLKGDGVDAFSYLTTFAVPASGSPVRISGGRGPLVHRFVRTAEGWLIKHRRYDPVATKPEVAWPAKDFGLSAAEIAETPGPERARGGRLRAVDYIDIEQLYAQAAFAFDSGSERGTTFARSFTASGVLSRGGVTTTGTAALAALAASRTPGVETWLSNMAIEPRGNGARGRVYVVVKGPDAERPVLDVGTFDDELIRTREGWRFSKRTYVSRALD